MGYLALQVSSLLVLAAALGSLVGWWGARLVYRQATAQCRIELSGLRRNYEDRALDNVNLRNKLQQLRRFYTTLPLLRQTLITVNFCNCAKHWKKPVCSTKACWINAISSKKPCSTCRQNCTLISRYW